MQSDRIMGGDGQLAARPELGVVLQLSNEMVRIYKELFGRGPTRARADSSLSRRQQSISSCSSGINAIPTGALTAATGRTSHLTQRGRSC